MHLSLLVSFTFLQRVNLALLCAFAMAFPILLTILKIEVMPRWHGDSVLLVLSPLSSIFVAQAKARATLIFWVGAAFYESLQGIEIISPLHWIEKISPRPLLLVHGDADKVVLVEQAYELYQKAKEPKELVIIPDAKHKLRLEEKAMDTVLHWLKIKTMEANGND